MVSVGQQLSLMCIGQDVRGNIKLSLKATLPRSEFKTDIVDEPVAPASQVVNVWAAIEDVSNEQEKQGATAGPETNDSTLKSATPAVLIRSAAECDEEEKSDGLNSKSDNGSQSASKSDKKTRTPSSRSGSGFSSRNAKKSKRGKDAILDLISDDESEQKHTSEVGLHSQIGSDKDDATSETPMSANKLKLGMRVTAKVHQIRALGLVLDLGGGIRGMYRFEVCLTLLLYYFQLSTLISLLYVKRLICMLWSKYLLSFLILSLLGSASYCYQLPLLYFMFLLVNIACFPSFPCLAI